MTLPQLSAAPSATQIKALLRGLPAKALHECASLVGLSPSRLARMLRCTRRPRGRYRLYTSEQLLRLAVLRREFDRLFGDHAIAKMQAPVPGFGGASTREFAVTETGYRVVREFMTGAAFAHARVARPISPDLHRKLIKVLVEAKDGGATVEQVTSAFRRVRGTVFGESVGNYVLESAAPLPAAATVEPRQMRNLLLRIHSARVAMNHEAVAKALDDVDAFFREPNCN